MEPKIGDKLYVPTLMSLSHGQDDIIGGLATIKKVKIYENYFEHNRVFIEFYEICKVLNWNYIKENQEKWSEEYNGKTARNDPDYHDYGYRW